MAPRHLEQILGLHNMIITLKIVFSVTCYSESHDAITIYCISQVFVNKGQIGFLGILNQ